MDRASMESENKRVFPLSREFYEEFTFYYPFGNTPAEDFLRSVSVADSREPSVLSLGCGDMRSPMFTIVKNFGFDGKISPNGFSGVHFVLNDYNASVLARNVLILYLCKQMPSSKEERKQWLASVWSIWYNHEWNEEHHKIFIASMNELNRWSHTQEKWSECPLGNLVRFSSPAMFAAVKMIWKKWLLFSMTVNIMRAKRCQSQHYHMNQAKTRERALEIYAENDPLLRSMEFFLTSEMYESLQKEHLEYLLHGTVWAEEVLGIPVDNSGRHVNPTFFEHKDGLYTFHYGLSPYLGFTLNFQYTLSEVLKLFGVDHPVFLPVNDAHFKYRPHLANCFQQFSMRLQATANIMICIGSRVSFTLIMEDSLSFCFSLFRFPGKYCIEPIFDAIYTSNLLDHVSPPALVLHSLPLLKPNGTLFTTTFRARPDFLEVNFGFSPDLFPALLGISCIGQDGSYSPAVNPTPTPNLKPSFTHDNFVWRNVESDKLVLDTIQESPLAIDSLLKCCSVNTLIFGTQVLGSAESFICVLHRFLQRIKTGNSIDQFLQPLSDAIKCATWFKQYLLALQTQLWLHDIHMHLTDNRSDCPICQEQSLDSYFQQLTLSIDTEECKIESYKCSTFEIQFSSPTNPIIIKSYSVLQCGSKLNLTFFLPKAYLRHCDILRALQYQNSTVKVHISFVQELVKSSAIDYLFMKRFTKTATEKQKNSLGYIIKHVGNGHMFETVLVMSDKCMEEVNSTKVEAKCCESNKLELRCGPLKTTITYPFLIKVNNTTLKTNKQIVVSVQRIKNLLMKCVPTYYIDPLNEVLHPQFCWGIRIMEKFCSLQSPLSGDGRSVISVLRKILIESMNGKKVFKISSQSDPGKCYAVLCVHGLWFNTEFDSPVLYTSFCFLHDKVQKILFTLHKTSVICQNIIVNDAEFLHEIFTYFSTNIRHPFPCKFNSITMEVKKEGLWEHFDHAVLFPLYPNHVNSDNVKLTDFSGRISLESLIIIGQGRRLSCSYCRSTTVPLLIKCKKCHQASYCSDQCQNMHWKFHIGFCENSTQLSFEEIMCALQQSSEGSGHVQCATSLTKEVSSSSDVQRKCSDIISLCQRCKKPGTILCQCQQVSYCSKACQTLEQPEHSVKCKPAANKIPCLNPVNKKEIAVATLSTQKCKVSGKCIRCKKPATIMCQCEQVLYCDKMCQTLEEPVHVDTCRKTRKTPGPSESKAKCKESKEEFHVAPKCSNCGKTKSSLKRCKCKNVFYCDDKCQRLHWPQHKHNCSATLTLNSD